jgi:hypothetical protein
VRAASCILVVCAALLSGCGGDEPAGSTGAASAAPAVTATTAPATTPTATTEPEAIAPLDGATDEPVVEPAVNAEVAQLTAVRAARHEGYDRVVFEFANVLPGYDLRYADGPIQADGSGDEVPVAGRYVVIVRMENALDADLSKPEAPMTYTGPQRFSPGTPQVTELIRVGGFEGVLTWAVGLAERVDYRVSTLDDPPRLVVDFRSR